MPSQLRIAIVGGGPAGLTMGVVLHKHGIPFTIFELRQKPTDDELAKPSGMLDLHKGSGLAVIEECDLHAEFAPLTGECSEDFLIANRDGDLVYKANGGGLRPEISRNNLAKLLSGHIPAESIKWGHRLLSATRHDPETAETELDFGALGKHTFDLVVGADGAWSRVRELLTDVRPQFTGTHCITVTIRNLTSRYPHLAELVGTGSFSAFGNRHLVVSQRGPIDSSRIYLWLTVPDEHFATTAGLAGKPASDAKETLVGDDALLGTFGASVKELVATACDEEAADNPGAGLDIRPFYALPYGSAWQHKRGVTLVGDAAHLMLPNGEGVNMAMFDSFLLSQAVVKACEAAGGDLGVFQSTFDPLLQSSEVALVQRAEEEGKSTDAMIKKMLGTDNAAYEFASFIQAMVAQHHQE